MNIYIHLKPLNGKYRDIYYSDVWGIKITQGETHTCITIMSGEDKQDFINFPSKDYINVSVDINKE